MSGEKAPKKQSFLQGVAVLTAATIIVKLLGFIYKVPLQNILQERGFGYFNTAYDVYNVLLMISTTGLPVAVSRMISQAQALENYAQIRKIYSVSMKVFLTIGVIGTLVMLVFCKPLSVMVTTNENSWAAIAALSPCVLLICIVSAHRGFFQGQSNMTPTSVSQVYEAMIRVVFGLGGAYLMLKKTGSLVYAAAGGIFGVTAGCIVAVVYLRIQFGKSNQILQQGGGEAKSGRQTMKELLVIAIPITLSASMVSIITLIDTSLVQGQLQNALGYTLKETRHLYGTYSSGMNLYNLPSSMMTALTISVIPTVSASLARNDRVHTSRVINSSLRVTGLMAFPMGLGLWALAEPIMKLCYPRYDSELGGSLLAVLGIASMFVCLMLISNSILQSYGRVHVPVFTMLIGGVVKIIFNYNLTAVPSINIHAAPFGTLVCFVIVSSLNLFFVYRTMEDKPNYFKVFAKPLIASLVMAVCARFSYRFFAAHIALGGATTTQIVNVGLAVVLAVIVYVALVLALRIVTRDDLALLPKGEKLARILHVR